MKQIVKIVIISITLLVIAGCGSDQYSSDFSAYKGYTAQQLYTNGAQCLAKKDYAKAVKYFEAIDALYPFGVYAQRGQLASISAYYRNGDYDSAIAAATRYIRLYPTAANIDHAYYLRGSAYFNHSKNWIDNIYTKDPAERDLSSYKKAFADFATIVKYYPKSQYAKQAKRHMLFIRNAIARHELNIAKFYYQHKAYVAAANRAAYIVQHIEGTPQVIPALQLMVKAYRKLGATRQANEASQTLQKNYPQRAAK